LVALRDIIFSTETVVIWYAVALRVVVAEVVLLMTMMVMLLCQAS